MARGSRPGERRGGRKKGTPNHVTRDAREAFKRVFDGLAPEVESWIRSTADGDVRDTADGLVTVRAPDPGKAADLLIKLAEYHVPKLGRVEVTGADGGPVELVIRDLGREGGA